MGKRKRKDTTRADRALIRALVHERIKISFKVRLLRLWYAEEVDRWPRNTRDYQRMKRLADRIEQLERQLIPVSNKAIAEKFDIAENSVSSISRGRLGSILRDGGGKW